MTADTRATDAATVSIAELDPADPVAVDGAYQVRLAARRHDLPDLPLISRHRFEVELRVPWPAHETRRWIARDGEEVVGYLTVGLPTVDNLENADVEVYVAPAHRRRGVGRRLYQHAAAFCRTSGRRRVMGFSPEESPGAAFAAALGMANTLSEVRRRLDVSTVDWPAVDADLAAARLKAVGYSLVQWGDTTPDEYVDDVAVLDSRLMQDAPMGDSSYEPEKIDAARLRAQEEVRIRYGSRSFSTGARHDESGRLVAWSALIQEDGNPDHAWQGITIVHPDHRGRRLGALVKITNLRYAMGDLPELRYIDTWNAAVNAHMISINEAMGFRAAGSWANWEQQL